ncbi:MAG: DUF4230 domain-containing protein [Firmicutes bacterium]|nr:DUF4230 domain-containing protein [Bacillota bacterium]
MKKIKRIITLITILAAFVGGAALADYLGIDFLDNNKGKVSVEDLQVEILEISEMASLEYNYKNDFEYDGGSLKFFDKDIPFTNKSMTVYYEGIVKIGTNMQDAEIKLDDSGDKVSITVPHCKVLSHEIDEESFEVKDVKNGLFNRVKLEDDTDFRKKQKKAIEKKIKEDGVFDEADEKLDKQLKSYFKMAYPELEVEVTFK